jgi:hypothetical protein
LFKLIQRAQEGAWPESEPLTSLFLYSFLWLLELNYG